MKRFIFTIILIFIITPNLFATTNFVSLTGNHIPPFANWADAATNIQSAVDVASANDTVLVNDGTYYPTNQIFITKIITVKSVNGAEKTIVDGGFPVQTNRCFYLENNPTINGFTIINGYTWDGGGGVYCFEGGTIQDCIISGNSANWKGGGVKCNNNGYDKNSTIISCTINGNLAGFGGGVSCDKGDTIQNCIISRNSAQSAGGIHCDNGGTIQNCAIVENVADYYGGVHFFFGGSLVNCTICKNKSIKGQIDGVYCEGHSGSIYNSIIYGHNAEGLWFRWGFENRVNRVKTLANQTKNCWFGRPPGFVDIKNNDFRLSRKSLCINKGTTNFNFSLSKIDFAGNSRVMNGRIDIGAYEYNRDIFTKYIIKWNKTNKDKIIFKSKFKKFKQLGENLSVKIGDSFIVSNLEPFKVTTKVAKYKRKTAPKFIAMLKVKPDGILAKIKCLKLNNLDNILNITNETVTDLWRDLDVEYFLGTNMFADKISTRYRSKKDKFCKGQKP